MHASAITCHQASQLLNAGIGTGPRGSPQSRRCVKEAVLERRRDLIESVAEDIAAALLHRNARVTGVRVSVRKPHVAIEGHFDAMGVSIFRAR